MITAHALPGPGLLTGVSEAITELSKNSARSDAGNLNTTSSSTAGSGHGAAASAIVSALREPSHGTRGVLLLAHMSSKGNLLT